MKPTIKGFRLSTDKQTEYQIEYTRARGKGEYRVRRGTFGTWTRWFPVDAMEKILKSLGFVDAEATLLEDFYVEAHFGRGVIRVNQDTALDFAKDSSDTGRYVYSRLKQISAGEYQLPASVITNSFVFNYIYDAIKRNL